MTGKEAGRLTFGASFGASSGFFLGKFFATLVKIAIVIGIFIVLWTLLLVVRLIGGSTPTTPAVSTAASAPLTTHSSAPNPKPVYGGASPDFDWPTAALPREISDALVAPDLVPDAPGAIAVMLGPPGLKQVVSVTEPCTGSGGCGWDLMDASSGGYLIENDLGGLHQATETTNGYYDY